jgi:hypothetical protein
MRAVERSHDLATSKGRQNLASIFGNPVAARSRPGVSGKRLSKYFRERGVELLGRSWVNGVAPKGRLR